MPFHIPNGPHVQALFKELSELRYRLKAEKSELETKEDLMLRLNRSPDFADALCMTFRVEATYGQLIKRTVAAVWVRIQAQRV